MSSSLLLYSILTALIYMVLAQAQRDEDIRPNNIDRNLEYSNDVEMESDKRFSNCVSHVFSNSVEMLSENRSSSGNNADLVAFGHGQVNSSLR